MEFKQLFENYSQPGKIEIIQIRPARLAPMVNLSEVLANAERGLEGDRYKSNGGNRQVTMFQFEHLKVIASLLGKSKIDPALTRRNIIVSGLNLLSLKGKTFKIGDALFEYSGECQPCSRMEENFGPGGYNAMRGHGGITAKVLESGRICVGDLVFAYL
jgi:MOSC domain-containing protein YiiM